MTESLEWVGGKIAFPFKWREEGRTFVPEVFIWVEMPNILLLSCHMVNPKAPKVSFPESLMEAMSTPLYGPPRIPDRIRIEDSLLIAELGPTLENIDVKLGPTPELGHILDEICKRMLESNLISSF